MYSWLHFANCVLKKLMMLIVYDEDQPLNFVRNRIQHTGIQHTDIQHTGQTFELSVAEFIFWGSVEVCTLNALLVFIPRCQ